MSINIIFNSIITKFVILFIIYCKLQYINTNEIEVESFRLPNHTEPLTYDLNFTINENNTTFSGLTIIKLLIHNKTNEIILNAKNLNISKIILNDIINKIYLNIRYNHNNEIGFIRIFPNDSEYFFMPNAKLKLKIHYYGKINEHPRSIFKSNLNKSDNFIIVTHFEATYARRAFPCFDEPKFKAKFTIRLTHNSSYLALSNMPGESYLCNNGLTKVTTFEQTPPMSTYIIAFSVTNYQHVTRKHNNITYTVFYNNEINKLKSEYTLNKTIEIVTSMEKIFQTQYPLPKLDQIPIPEAYGVAMENWGLITYDKKYFPLNQKCKNVGDVNAIVAVVHEISHQWFGNLVTPKWWTYTWLNEGFATYYGYLIADMLFPECRIYEFYMMDSSYHAFLIDKTRPLTHYVDKEKDIDGTFDSISYNRGAAVIRMLENCLSRNTFNKGILNYLTKWRFLVVGENDLFESLELAAIQDNIPFFNIKGDLTKFMTTWTHNNGYPQIKVNRNYTNGEIIISNIDNNKNQYWYIPITFATLTNSDFNDTTIHYIMPPIKSITIKPTDYNLTLNANDWLILNKKQIGLYRINYDNENWLKISKVLNENYKIIHPSNRVQILKDAYHFLQTKSIEVSTFFELYSYLINENDLFVWDEAGFVLTLMIQLNMTKESKEYLKYFIRTIILNIFKILSDGNNTDNDNTISKKLKSGIYDLSCTVELVTCFVESYNQLQLYLQNGNFKKNIKPFCGGIKFFTNNEFEIILKKILQISNVGDDLVTYLTPLACTDDKENIKLLLNEIIKIISLNENDISYVLYLSNEYFQQHDFIKSFILDYWLKNFKLFTIEIDYFAQLLSAINRNHNQLNEKETNKLNLIIEQIHIIPGQNITHKIADDENKDQDFFDEDNFKIWIEMYKTKQKLTNPLTYVNDCNLL